MMIAGIYDIECVFWIGCDDMYYVHIDITICDPWCWSTYLHDWVILFGPTLVNTPASWFACGIHNVGPPSLIALKLVNRTPSSPWRVITYSLYLQLIVLINQHIFWVDGRHVYKFTLHQNGCILAVIVDWHVSNHHDNYRKTLDYTYIHA